MKCDKCQQVMDGGWKVCPFCAAPLIHGVNWRPTAASLYFIHKGVTGIVKALWYGFFPICFILLGLKGNLSSGAIADGRWVTALSGEFWGLLVAPLLCWCVGCLIMILGGLASLVGTPMEARTGKIALLIAACVVLLCCSTIEVILRTNPTFPYELFIIPLVMFMIFGVLTKRLAMLLEDRGLGKHGTILSVVAVFLLAVSIALAVLEIPVQEARLAPALLYFIVGPTALIWFTYVVLKLTRSLPERLIFQWRTASFMFVENRRS